MNRMCVLHEKDNVGTVIAKIVAGETIRGEINGVFREVTAVEDVPLGHKIALKNFALREPIFKYGEVIGEAGMPIIKGALVHVHNVQSLRGRGDLAQDELAEDRAAEAIAAVRDETEAGGGKNADAAEVERVSRKHPSDVADALGNDKEGAPR